MSYAIEVKNLTKKFQIHHERKDSLFDYIRSFFHKKQNVDELVVLDNISFNIKKGEVLGIIGLNGSGKSTLLKIIANIYSSDKGKIITNGIITPFLDLGTGFNGELTARDNIIIYGVILGLDKHEIIQKVDEIAKYAEIEKFLDTTLKNFSSGMNARLSFSTAIHTNPDILLVDEVLAVGDLSFYEKSVNAFLEFKKQGKTILVVSHSINQVQELCDRVILLHNGKIFSEGKPKEVIKKYLQIVEEKRK